MVRNHKLDRQHICSCKERSFGNIFFERPAQDSACFIDIAEKYKATALECHNQEKRKRKQKIELTRLDWDINPKNSTTQLTRLD